MNRRNVMALAVALACAGAPTRSRASRSASVW